MNNLKELNPTVEIQEETEHININNLWNDKTFHLRYSKKENLDLFSDIILPEEFSAIIHKKHNKIEFIYAPVKNVEKEIGRKFDFQHNSEAYVISFEEPSETLKKIAKGFKILEQSGDSRYRNLRYFRDYYREDQNEGMKAFFKDRTPINMFISGNLQKITDIQEFAKTINFYLRYYDRRSPTITIIKENFDDGEFNQHCINDENKFPNHINSVQIEPVILDLFQIAIETPNNRLKYLFYYQVLEYCSYYYLNENLKRKLKNIIRTPDIINNSEKYSRNIIEEFKDHFKSNDDRVKLEKLISEHCEFEDVKNEIEANKEYFSKELEFDGGFKLRSLITEEHNFDKPPKDIMKSIVDRIDKIRNVLVHIRESRENKVIFPTKKNNHQLLPYIYLIRRIAETIAIKYE